MPNSQEILIRQNDWVTGAQRVTLFPSSSKWVVDETAAPATTYRGYAAPNTDTTSPNWFIEKITVSGGISMGTHATGAWDNRSSLTYT